MSIKFKLERIQNLFQDEFNVIAIDESLPPNKAEPDSIIGIIKGPMKMSTISNSEKLFNTFINNIKNTPFHCTCKTGPNSPKIVVTTCPTCNGILW